MLGHKSGGAKRIQDLQTKAYTTRCHGHALSSSVKDRTKAVSYHQILWIQPKRL